MSGDELAALLDRVAALETRIAGPAHEPYGPTIEGRLDGLEQVVGDTKWAMGQEWDKQLAALRATVEWQESGLATLREEVARLLAGLSATNQGLRRSVGLGVAMGDLTGHDSGYILAPMEEWADSNHAPATDHAPVAPRRMVRVWADGFVGPEHNEQPGCEIHDCRPVETDPVPTRSDRNREVAAMLDIWAAEDEADPASDADSEAYILDALEFGGEDEADPAPLPDMPIGAVVKCASCGGNIYLEDAMLSGEALRGAWRCPACGPAGQPTATVAPTPQGLPGPVADALDVMCESRVSAERWAATSNALRDWARAQQQAARLRELADAP